MKNTSNNNIINLELDNALKSMNIGIIELDFNNKIINITKGINKIFSFLKSSIINKPIRILFKTNNYKKVEKLLNSSSNIENYLLIKLKGHNNENIFLKISKTNEQDYSNFFLIIQNISETHQQFDELTALAFYDQLTKIPNKTLFLDRAAINLNQSLRYNQKFCIIYIDIDNFKTINDSMGHHAGDIILQELSQKLKRCIRDSDTVARIGGDEFLILLQNISTKHEINTILERIIESNSKSITIDDSFINLKISLGVSIYPEDGDSIKILIQNADKAMYRCKKFKTPKYIFHDKK